MSMELINAGLYAGLPVLAITFLLFGCAYYTGFLVPRDEYLEEDQEQLEDVDMDYPDDLNVDKKFGNFVMDKWFEFGGGYFGLMVLITFFHLELKEIVKLGSTLLGVHGVGTFVQAIVEFLIQLVIESFMNVIHAFTWWVHWSKELSISEGSGIMWLGASYVGYLAGEWLAGFFKKRETSGSN